MNLLGKTSLSGRAQPAALGIDVSPSAESTFDPSGNAYISENSKPALSFLTRQ